jgi:hypothetical protein
MRKTVFAVVALAMSAGTVLAQSDPVSGAADRFFSVRPGGSAPASPYDFDGDKCDGIPAGANVWWGRFAGGKATFRSGGGQKIRTFTSEGCFRSARACDSWLLALKTKYNARPIYNQCRRGYEPGADVPPWYSPESS